MHERKLRDRYDLLGNLGSGATGEFFLARDKISGEQVAIKQFLGAHSNIQSALKEASVIQGLQHDNIVRCLDFFNEGTTELFLVYEFLRGGNLRDYLEIHQQRTHLEALECLRQILEGLRYLHQLELIHCDLKPENIVFENRQGNYIFKLCDFDVALFEREIPEDWTVEGSPAYMAPERFGDEFSYESDLYSVGVIFYELLLGRRPFSGSLAKLAYDHQHTQPDLSGICDAQERQLLERLLEKNPQKRIPSAEAALLKLSEIPSVRRYRPVEVRDSGTLEVKQVFRIAPPATSGSLEELGEVYIPGDIDWMHMLQFEDHPYLGVIRDHSFSVYDGISGQLLEGDIAWESSCAQASRPSSLVYHTKRSICRFDISDMRETVILDGVENVTGVCLEGSGQRLLWTDSRLGYCKNLLTDEISKFPSLNFGITPHLRFCPGHLLFTNGPVGPALNLFDESGSLTKKYPVDGPILNVTDGEDELFLVALSQGAGERYALYHLRRDMSIVKGYLPDNMENYSSFGHYFMALMKDGTVRTYTSTTGYKEFALDSCDYRAIVPSLDNRFIMVLKEVNGGCLFHGYRNHE